MTNGIDKISPGLSYENNEINSEEDVSTFDELVRDLNFLETDNTDLALDEFTPAELEKFKKNLSGYLLLANTTNQLARSGQIDYIQDQLIDIGQLMDINVPQNATTDELIDTLFRTT